MSHDTLDCAIKKEIYDLIYFDLTISTCRVSIFSGDLTMTSYFSITINIVLNYCKSNNLFNFSKFYSSFLVIDNFFS